MNDRLRIRQDIRAQEMGSELMLFDEKADKVHVLNATGAVVWKALCEGCDRAAIEARLRDAFDTQGQDVSAVAQRALDTLRACNLFEG